MTVWCCDKSLDWTRSGRTRVVFPWDLPMPGTRRSSSQIRTIGLHHSSSTVRVYLPGMTRGFGMFQITPLFKYLLGMFLQSYSCPVPFRRIRRADRMIRVANQPLEKRAATSPMGDSSAAKCFSRQAPRDSRYAADESIRVSALRWFSVA
jgi:hypothetical protein